MKFKVGDEVRVTRKPTDEELDEWGEIWLDSMDTSVGKVLTVLGSTFCGYMCKNRLSVLNNVFPEFILEKVYNKKDLPAFANEILLQYAEENGINGRDTTDLSPLEKWLIKELFESIMKS